MRIELTIDISRRWLVLVGMTLLIATSLAMAGLAQAHGGSTDLIHTCYQSEKGNLRWVASTDTCLSSEKPLDWSKGHVLRSPNGLFTLAMSDTGIVMQGPNSSVKVSDGSIEVNGSTVAVTAGGAATVRGGTLTLGGISGTEITSEKDLKLSSGATTSLTARTNVAIAAATAADVSGGTSARITSGGVTTVNGGTVNVTGTNGIAALTEKDLKLTGGASASIAAGGEATVTAGTTAKIAGGGAAVLTGPSVTVNGTSTTTSSVAITSSGTTQITGTNEVKLSSGDSSASLRKDGDVSVAGKGIQVSGSGAVGLKGSTVSLNGTCRPITLSGGVNSASVLGC